MAGEQDNPGISALEAMLGTKSPAPAEAEPSPGFTPTSPAVIRFDEPVSPRGIALADNTLTFRMGAQSFSVEKLNNGSFEIWIIDSRGARRFNEPVGRERAQELAGAFAEGNANRAIAALTERPAEPPPLAAESALIPLGNAEVKGTFNFGSYTGRDGRVYDQITNIYVAATSVTREGYDTPIYQINRDGSAVINSEVDGVRNARVEENARDTLNTYIRGLLENGLDANEAKQLDTVMRKCAEYSRDGVLDVNDLTNISSDTKIPIQPTAAGPAR